jgi:hypothetical protein
VEQLELRRSVYEIEIDRMYGGKRKAQMLTTHIDAWRIRKLLLDWQESGRVAEAVFIGAAKRPDVKTAESRRRASNDTIERHIASCASGKHNKWLGGLGTVQDVAGIFDDWKSGQERLRKFVDDLPVPHIESIVTRYRHKDRGPGKINAMNLVRRDLNHLFRVRKKTRARAQGVIEIVMPFGENGGASADQAFWRAATGIVTARLLKDAGYRVGLTAVSAVSLGMNYTNAVIRVVNPGNPIDIEVAAAATAHIGVYRTAGFTMDCADIPIDGAGSLGGALKGPRWRKQCEAMIEVGALKRPDVWLGESHSKASSEEAIKKGIEEALGRN